jgi:hypothetical protein
VATGCLLIISPTSAQVEVKNGQTALTLLQQTHQIETKEYDFGTLVESIEGVKNGTAQSIGCMK